MNQKTLLISEHVPYFKYVAQRSLPKRFQHLAEDLAQDAIIKAIQNIHKHDDSKGNLKSWLYTLTQRVCFDALRKLDKIDEVPLQISYFKVDEDVITFDDFDKKKIQMLLEKLSERDRMILLMKFMYDYSGKEISEAIGIPERQVAIYYKRAKERLKSLYLKAA